MRNQMEAILIYMDSLGLLSEKRDVMDSMDLLCESFGNIGKAAKKKMHECIDNDEYDKIQDYRKMCSLIDQVITDIELTKTASKYKPTCGDAMSQPNLVKRALNENMEHQTPYKIIIESETYILEKPTFRCLFETVFNLLASKDGDRFLELVDVFNKVGTKYCKFAKCKSDFKDENYPISEIKAVDMFVQYQGQANALCERILYALAFFNLDDKYELYLNGRVRGVRKKNEDDE